MYVYAVMRGTDLLRLFRSEDSATNYAVEYNVQFTRGNRATVVPMKLHD